MKLTAKLFLDTEFTGLRQDTTLISLALVGLSGEEFYAEFTDYDTKQLTPWLEEHVIANLCLTDANQNWQHLKKMHIKGGKKEIATALKIWFGQFELKRDQHGHIIPNIQIWGDVPHWDWVLFCELFGGAFEIPKNIHYMCLDLATFIQFKGYSVEIPRIKNEEGYGLIDYIDKDGLKLHNALFDARMELVCFKELNKM